MTEFHSLAYIFPHRITPAQKIPHMLRSLGSQNNSGNFNAAAFSGTDGLGSECEHSFMEYKVSTTSFLIIEKCGCVPHFSCSAVSFLKQRSFTQIITLVFFSGLNVWGFMLSSDFFRLNTMVDNHSNYHI